MAEAIQQEQQQQNEQLPQAMSDEDIMAKAMGVPAPGDRQRDEKGRFTPQQEQAAADQAAQADKPAAESAEQDAQQEYKWDDLKNIKLKIPMKNGEKEWEEELSLDELRSQRLMHSDYMARRRELDEQARTHETKAKEAVEKERTGYLSSLEALHKSIIQAASPELANVDWNKLAQENPAEYVRLSNRAREVNAALERVRFEHEKAQTQQAKERDEHLAKAAGESKAKLREAIPDWSDEKYETLIKRAADTYGFKREEASQWWDHRVMQVLHDAHQFRLLKETKPTADKKVENAPPVLKPGSQKPKVDQKQAEWQNAQKRLRENPNDMDAGAALINQFLTPKGRAQ